MPNIRRLIQSFLFLCLLACSCAQAEELYALVPAKGGTLEVRSTLIEEEHWFFLPSHTDIAGLSVKRQDGSILDASMISQKDGSYLAACADLTCRFMQSDNIRSLFVFSDDPENHGRQYIDSSADHSAFSTGTLLMLGEDGSIDHVEEIRKLRGRGNGTWSWEKKPYQIKLENKTDLLDTKNPEERERTWVLLALATDGTYLHDRITFDLAKELGDETASNSEHVNLYYDGEYRGLYLLCEKTEIGSGRIDELDYDEIIEELFERAGRSDLETLPAAQDTNLYGNSFSYIENLLETSNPASGAFLLELESAYTLSDPCWFTLSNGSVVALKSPEKASQKMTAYVSERLEEALQTLQNRGVNPDNGRTLAQDFDIEDFARSILLSEFSGNMDSYLYSSTFFVLPAGEERFSAGPPWDYDLAYRYPIRTDALLDATGFRDRNGWIQRFLGCREIRSAIKQICEEKLSFAVGEILLGEKHGVHLKPIDAYAAEIDAARRMNEMLWDVAAAKRLLYGESFDQEIALLKQYLSERSSWLFDLVSQWDLSDETVDLWADAAYTNVETDVSVGVYPWSNMQIASCQWQQMTEATEDAYAVWQMDIRLTAMDGYHFTNPVFTVNGTPVEATAEEDGSFLVTFSFEDPSYRPVDAYGEDIGMVYDYEVYIRRYPEVAELCENDPELVLDYFLDEGMYEGHQANAFFSPSEILSDNYYISEYLGEDWWLYYQEYIAYGYSEWVLPLDARFDLMVSAQE